MKITTYVPLTRGQDIVLDDFQKIEVRVATSSPNSVIATIRTFEQQEIRITINSAGYIESIKLVEV